MFVTGSFYKPAEFRKNCRLSFVPTGIGIVLGNMGVSVLICKKDALFLQKWELDEPADPVMEPENYYMEKWLEEKILSMQG